MPTFLRTDLLTRRAYEVTYDPDDPAKCVGERLMAEGEERPREKEAFFGHIAVQQYIARLLGYERPPLGVQ